MSSVTDYTSDATNVSNNPYLGDLKETLLAADRPIQWLVIADDDPAMLRALQVALQGETAATLKKSWDLPIERDNHLRTSIEWSLRNSSIKNVLLVGHSEAIGAACQSVLAKSPSEGPRLNLQQDAHPNASPLLDRINRNNARQQAAMRSYAEQFGLFAKIPTVKQRAASGDLTLYGLYYRAESGVFLAYDVIENRYRPLMES
ncbi:carbonic anhydrase [Roseiconus lacunae]|uniref:carbonic anhydrase n=1 Tax=Roseiconus lacunae TaxID=2605694 RepID=UPI0011F267E6|nr:carbonic anhydrase [Roseiconus lacunae]WRQ51301.1 carbonic anhydrase [Stieleria sp. HD01]